MKRIGTDRSRVETYQRCKRLRWLEYHAGPEHLGLTPRRKSIHLVIGGAVHEGLEVLLREGQLWLTDVMATGMALEPALEMLFVTSRGMVDGKSVARQIEDAAVEAAVAAVRAETEHGVELDALEQPLSPEELAKQQQARNPEAPAVLVDSPIEITFDDVETPATLKEQLKTSVSASGGDWGAPIYPEPSAATDTITPDDSDRLMEIQVKTEESVTGVDTYLREELCLQVEAMVRAYSRRRWRPLLTDFEVMEVEREGEWRLAQSADVNYWDGPIPDAEQWQLNFMSRHDALLRERTTGYLYLQSYKTTGAWDRRRAADAEVDMQGLSEAVDVERRMLEAWELLQDEKNEKPYSSRGDSKWRRARINELVNIPMMEFLAQQPEPLRILGVRYEYLIKGQRRQDKNDPEQPGRYVADTPLLRAYKQDGVTVDDRRWAHSYVYYDISGKEKRLSWQAWKKASVWKYMSITEWIDVLDRNEVQLDAYDAAGYPLDILAAQFIPPITVYRNEDDMRDMLEQLEAQERQVTLDVILVQNAEGQPWFQSVLNQKFPQSRHACSYPGLCAFRKVCYGSSEMKQHPEQSELYTVRVPNHPQEVAQ